MATASASTPDWLLNLMLPAIQDGREWGYEFLRDPRWGGDRDRMANHAIYEATLWSVGSGVATGVMGLAGMPLDIAYFYYTQIKLAAALFTIYGLDPENENVLMMLIPTALGVTAAELANHFGTQFCRQIFKTFGRRAAQKNLSQVLMAVFRQLPRPLLQQIFSKVSSKSLTLPARAVPLVSGVIGGATNAVMMNICGHGVCTVIKTFRSPSYSIA
ncbi:EcsC family protein [Thermosynechococcus sp. JY1334]|uniref:EcsC family protein n=2 Tax=Thermosynechococcus TaxID=146785 RepID=UPI0026729E89|nr:MULTISPECIES: EcsC family protein [unclassified Thermosynechococcus]MDR7905554.1 EcsC family protein [Thermosynechococcus sp. JY1334]WKT85284.1 EcsC family protein [Thermosynechococcus sp. JY1339]WNC54227.1 EcsC family protein [Thermosynechococcus sp. JY1331]